MKCITPTSDSVAHSIGNSFLETIWSRIKNIATSAFNWFKSFFWHTPAKPIVTPSLSPVSSVSTVATEVLAVTPEDTTTAEFRVTKRQRPEDTAVAAAPACTRIVEREERLSAKQGRFAALAFIKTEKLFNSCESGGDTFLELALLQAKNKGITAAEKDLRLSREICRCGFTIPAGLNREGKLPSEHFGPWLEAQVDTIDARTGPHAMIVRMGDMVLGVVSPRERVWKLFTSDGSRMSVDLFESGHALKRKIQELVPKAGPFNITALQPNHCR